MEQEEHLQRGRQFITRLEQLQYQYFNGRPKWTNIEFNNLKLFMAYTYFGSPFSASEISEITNNDIFEYYKSEEKLCILDMVKIIKQNIFQNSVSNIDVGFTFTYSICKMNCDICHNFPDQDVHEWRLLRVKLDYTNVVYIDLHHKRTYRDWNDYKDNNILPKGFMFFPELGYYDESKYLLQDLTPQSRKNETILSYIDLIGHATGFTSGILIAGGMLFPVMAPVLIPASIAAGSCSLWDIGRQLRNLADIVQHNQSLFSIDTTEHWCNLAIAALGLITAPMNAGLKTIKSSKPAFFTTNIGKSLCLIQRGTCIAQCSFEFLRFFMKINSDKFTLKDVMLFRLDLFVVLGVLLPIIEIEEILKFAMSTSATMAMTISRKILEIPYCATQYIITAICFVQKHIYVFMEKLQKCLSGKLTLDKCLCAWSHFRKYLNTYKEKTSMLTPAQILKHIVYDTDIVFRALPDKFVGELSNIKSVLCGIEMCELLKQLNADQTAIRFYVGHILNKARAVYMDYEESVYKCLSHGKMDINEIDTEFCKVYQLKSCQMVEYVKFIIREAALDVNEYAKALQEHLLKPENNFDELMIASGSVGSQSIHTYNVHAPCSNLNSDICKKFAQTLDSQNNDYNTCYQYSEPEPNASILFSFIGISVRIVFFHIDMVNGLPILSISLYRDSQLSMPRMLYQ